MQIPGREKDEHGYPMYAKKPTTWMTNRPELASTLAGTCENELKGYEVHRHSHLIGCLLYTSPSPRDSTSS
eukprot:3841080-Prorocentrum_lima.AAC.1